MLVFDKHNVRQVVGFMSIVMALMSVMVNVWGIFQEEQASKLFLGVVLLHQNLWLFNSNYRYIPCKRSAF
jgi:hypothetical protein